MLADGAKHNQQGRVDEHGAFRHRLVDHCPVGGAAFLLFAHFHVLGSPVPEFTPDFKDESCGEYGRRKWYDYHMFWAQSIESEMCYDSAYLIAHVISLSVATDFISLCSRSPNEAQKNPQDEPSVHLQGHSRRQILCCHHCSFARSH